MYRFYIEGASLEKSFQNGGLFVLDKPEVIHQLRHVFRSRAGEEIILFDGDGYDYIGEVTGVGDRKSKKFGAGVIRVSEKGAGVESMHIQLKEKLKNSFVSNKILILNQSILKKDNFELVTEKATELGVSKIVPIISERSEKKGINEDRIKKISVEATEQCGRNLPPEILKILSLKDMLEKDSGFKIAFHLEGEPFHKEILKEKSNQPISIYIGPEGGWSENDLKTLGDHQVKILTMGAMTLRAETAAIAACTLILL